MTGTPTSDPEGSGSGEAVGSVDRRHLLLVGAGPGLGLAVAHRFAVGGYRVTLVARSTDALGDLAASLADTGAEIGTIEADASDPEGLGARMTELYRGERCAGSHHLQRGHGCAGSALEFERRSPAGRLCSRRD